MIKSFRCRKTEEFWRTSGRKAAPFAAFANVAMRKLRMLDAAIRIDDLKQPPGNRLEQLAKDRAGEYSIRVNLQYRVCFNWTEPDAFDVEIVDYH